MSTRFPKPQEYEMIAAFEAVYKGRHFYGYNASDRAELTYLRDLVRWYEVEMKSLLALERSVNEAINSGNGSYRP